MKKLTKVLELNDRDNGFTAFAKGGAKGLIGAVLGGGAILGGLAIIGITLRKEEVSVVEEIIEEVGE